MATTRTLTSSAGILDLRLAVGHVRVTVSPDAAQITVTLSTQDETGASAEAISRTTSSFGTEQFTIRVPDIAAPVISRSGLNLVSVGNSINGVSIGGDAFVLGNFTRAVSASPIAAEVLLPTGTALRIHSTDVTAEITGHLRALRFHAVSGRVRANSVADLVADTTSADIDVEVQLGPLLAQTISGDVAVGSYHGPVARISTVSGDVRLNAGQGATGVLNAETVSGDLRLGGTGRLAVSASTVSGYKQIT
ncbi:hypothetical protein KGQ20_39810 [Catenulispora sp. NF23]|uniref:DUF4097 family beta strand repeat-containing protein n=1 Tax=Catenulispora pinistramenti TaxID=2705254 RepID=UPI001BA8CC8F|nr:DUF4097 family beta strand repeat-containing protein [Catenulispora pinistramenti]MBS2538911.1 hypothetical protein [Catenulispora pinistramenti]